MKNFEYPNGESKTNLSEIGHSVYSLHKQKIYLRINLSGAMVI